MTQQVDVTMLAGHILLVFVVLTSSVLCFDLNGSVSVQYHEETDVIKVQIEASRSDYSFNHLELSMNRCSEKNKTILKHDVFRSQEAAQMDFHGPIKKRFYCVLVTPLTMLNKIECQTPCQPVFKELYISSQGKKGTTEQEKRAQRRNEMALRREKKDTELPKDRQNKLDCEEWDANPDTGHERNYDGTYQMRVKVNVESSFRSCFTSMNVSVWKDVKLCNSASGYIADSKIIKVSPDHEDVTVFGPLQPGIYCVRLYVPPCGVYCNVRHTGLMNFTDVPSEVVGHFPTPANTERSSLIYIVAGCVIFVVIIIAAVTMGYRYKFCGDIPLPEDVKGPTVESLIELAKNRAQRLEIVLLNSQDLEQHSDVVVALYHFLLNCFKVRSVRFDREEEATISVNLHSWVENITLPNSNRVFLVVESEGAVLQENGRRRLRLLRPENGDFLDDVFPYALQLLKNGTRGLCDYQTVFVARFQYTPDDLRLNCMVPNRRYTLPDHLFDLYCTLLNLTNPSVDVLKSFKDKMIKEWQGSFLEDLISKIQDVSQVISENPRIIEESFTEQDLFLTV